jgi:hypothetical protein
LKSWPRYQSGFVASFTYGACQASIASLHAAALASASPAILRTLVPDVPKNSV